MTEFKIADFVLAAGGILSAVTLAFQTCGNLSPARDNAILVTHGLTSIHLAAAPPPTLGRRIGRGREQIGPGLLYHTDRCFAISSNVLRSACGSTNAPSVNLATGRARGRGFPFVAMEDVVRAQERLVRPLGITRLKSVAGCSLGGFQAYQWKVNQAHWLSCCRLVAYFMDL